MHILSIQSQVVFGHVGHSAAMFPLQCLGHEVWAVPTAILSNHPGYPDFGGQVTAPETLADLLAGLERRGAFARCDLVISGYLGSADLGPRVAETLDRVRAANPDVVYCCDPVMGDDGPGLYVDRALPAHFADVALPAADIVTPNLFELEILCGLDSGSLRAAPVGEIVAAARGLLARMRPGGGVMVTSAQHRDLDPACAAVVACDDSEAWCVETPRLAFASAPHGAGDLISSLFAAAMAGQRSLAGALEDSVATVFAILSETERRGDRELALVAARDLIASPGHQFAVRSID